MKWQFCLLPFASAAIPTNLLLYFDPQRIPKINSIIDDGSSQVSSNKTQLRTARDGCYVAKEVGSCVLLIPSSTGSRSYIFPITMPVNQFISSADLHHDAYAVIVEPKDTSALFLDFLCMEKCLAYMGELLCQPLYRSESFDQYLLLYAAIQNESQCQPFNIIVCHFKFPARPKKRSLKRKARDFTANDDPENENKRTERKRVSYGDYVPSLEYIPRTKEKVPADLSVSYGDQVMLKSHSGVGPYIFLSHKICYSSTVLDMRLGRVVRISSKHLRKCMENEAISLDTGVNEDFTIKYILPKSPVLVVQNGSVVEGKLCVLNTSCELPVVLMEGKKVEVEWANLYPVLCRERLLARLTNVEPLQAPLQ